MKRKLGPYRGKPGNKRRKMDEAEYFHRCMMENEKYPGTFQFNYSAFLSAARSVLQYTHEEAARNKKPEALKWYEASVRRSKVIRFGRIERDENIHWAPVIPKTHATVTQNEPIRTGESGAAILAREGRIVKKIPIGSDADGDDSAPPLFAEVSYTYTSERWKGDENVLEVCRLYLDELKALVEGGVSKGYITW